MITIDSQKNVVSNASQFAFYGLSTDSKPSTSYDNKEIYNGSSFFEMDTGYIFLYNQASHQWIKI